MEAFFEDAGSIDYALTQKYPFYTFVNNSDQNIFPMAAHWHYFVEILYCTKGLGRVIINGYGYDFAKGDILFVFPRDVHTFNTVAGNDFEYIVIKLDPDMMFDSPKEAFAFKHFGQLITPIPPEYKIIKAEERMSFNKSTLKQVHELFYHKPYRFEWLAKSILMGFFYEYAHRLNVAGYPMVSDEVVNDDLSNIIPAFDYINEHYSENISAKSVAEHCHLSYSYFSRQFKKITGIAFTQYLNFLRITEAEKLLLDRSSSITDIGFQVGFTDTSYFIKQFKKFKKMTPKKFVQLIRDNF